MRAAAELHREVADRHDTDDLAVLVTEVRDRPGSAGLVERHDLGADVGIGEHARVHERLDRTDRVGIERGEVREVEAEATRLDERAGLLRVLADELLDGRVKDVRGGVAASRRRTTVGVDTRGDIDAGHDLTRDDARTVDAQPTTDDVLRVEDLEPSRGRLDDTAIPYLTAALRVEGTA